MQLRIRSFRAEYLVLHGPHHLKFPGPDGCAFVQPDVAHFQGVVRFLNLSAQYEVPNMAFRSALHLAHHLKRPGPGLTPEHPSVAQFQSELVVDSDEVVIIKSLIRSITYDRGRDCSRPRSLSSCVMYSMETIRARIIPGPIYGQLVRLLPGCTDLIKRGDHSDCILMGDSGRSAAKDHSANLLGADLDPEAVSTWVCVDDLENSDVSGFPCHRLNEVLRCPIRKEWGCRNLKLVAKTDCRYCHCKPPSGD